MRIIAFQGEKTVAELVARVYGTLPDAERERVASALLRANPQLEAIRELPRGATLVVPAVGGVRARDTKTDDAPAAAFVELASAAVTDYGRRLAAAASAEAGEAEADAKLLESREVQALLGQFPESKAYAERIAAASRARLADAAEARAIGEKELDGVRKELARLVEELG